MTHRRQPTFRRQWGWPTCLAGLTMLGLLSALLGEGGIWWWLSWASLMVPLLAIAYHLLRTGKGRHHARVYSS